MEVCEICGRAVMVMAFWRTGVCCEQCRKMRDDPNFIHIGVTVSPSYEPAEYYTKAE